MSKIKIQISGVGAELVLGNYMPGDETIYNDWQEFFHFNDVIHESQLLSEHVSEIEIKQDELEIFKGKITDTQFQPQKSFSPVLVQLALYLRTECVEQSVFQCEFETENFDKNKLCFETQDYDLLFKVGRLFITGMVYDELPLSLEWVSAHPIGNICLLCRYENGHLVPVYDAIKKLATK
jgi:hypothetical protein